ncbi:MAG: nucleoside triphosphate pyrophosphohydrolase [Candidatus Merdivicinus sp.]|jgi:tetrapyrrole methylase family protein/MazG family protein
MDDLLKIMEILRGENGCPWDREQTHQTIRGNFIEETYEAVEAIDKQDSVLLREELGDVLLQVVFHARMEEEAGSFAFGDVVHDICSKLIIRHPHIFADVTVQNTDEVLANWEAIKNSVKGTKTQTERLRAVPAVYPALMRSQKVASRAAKAGLDYRNPEDAWKDLESEISELKEAIAEENVAHIEEEMGDLLFSVVNVSRHMNVDSEYALTRSCEKFIDRFEQVELLAQQKGIALNEADPQTLDDLWKQAKKLMNCKETCES